MEEKNYEKIQLFDAIADAKGSGANYSIYSDYFGALSRFEELRIASVSLHGGRSVNSYEVYYKHDANEVKRLFELDYHDIVEVFSKDLYSDSRCSEKIDIYEVEICVGYYSRNYYGYSNPVSGRKFKFTADTIEKLNHTVWKIPKNSSERQANLTLLKVGDLVYFDSVGTYRIAEAYEPNRESKLFKAEYLYSNTSIEITENNRGDVYQVPYIEYPNELEQFNELLNENALRPCVLRDGNNYNVFWLPIEDAMQYTVSIYKYCGAKDNKLYHLHDFCVDRNTRYLKVENVLGQDFIFRVTAENRKGEIIAKSRGINNGGFPRFW